jgi:hypothetical protein
MRISLKSALAAAALVSALGGSAFAAQNSPGTSNNAANPLMTMEEFMAMATSADHKSCMEIRKVYDRHGHSLGQGMISTCK